MSDNETPWESYPEAFKAMWNAMMPPNRAVREFLDLTIARSDESLVTEGFIPADKTFRYLQIVSLGDGVFSFKVKFSDDSTITYLSTELTDGFLIEKAFVDILFTNDSQTVTNPKLLIEWRD